VVFDSIFPRVLRKKERERERSGRRVGKGKRSFKSEEEGRRERERETKLLSPSVRICRRVREQRAREIIGATGRDRDELF
jgi:hypothetical protein